MKSLLILIFFALMACSTPMKSNQGRLEIKTAPEGGIILVDSQTRKNQADLTWTFSTNGGRKVVAVTAFWKSGAKVTENYLVSAGGHLQIIMKRPQYPNLEIDLAYAKENYGGDNSALLFLLDATNVALEARNNAKGSTASSQIYTQIAPTISNSTEQNKHGYMTKDSLGNLVNSRSSYQTTDMNGNLVNSRSNYKTKDMFGNIVDSQSKYQVRDIYGVIRNSDD